VWADPYAVLLFAHGADRLLSALARVVNGGDEDQCGANAAADIADISRRAHIARR